jgi:hypothetical protein
MSKQQIRRFNDGILFVFEGEVEMLLQQREQELPERGVSSYVLRHPDDRSIDTMRRFHDAVQYSIPIGHSVQYSSGGAWSALTDVIWQGLDGLDIEFVDVVWKDADLVAEVSLPTLTHGILFLVRAFERVQKEYGARHDLFHRIILTSKNRDKFQDWFIES